MEPHHTNIHEYEEPIGESTIVTLDHYIGSRILTNFYRTSARFNSTLINFAQYLQLFRGELRTQQSPKLIFRASRDGFSDVTFHKQCDDQGKIVIIVKSKAGDLFGGYTTQTLKLEDDAGSNVKDEHAFTFRFESDRLHIFRLNPLYSAHALYRYSSTYLFAFGYCFWLCNNADKQNLSSSHASTDNCILPECQLPGNSSSEKRYYAGYDFLVEEFEVYKIMDY